MRQQFARTLMLSLAALAIGLLVVPVATLALTPPQAAFAQGDDDQSPVASADPTPTPGSATAAPEPQSSVTPSASATATAPPSSIPATPRAEEPVPTATPRAEEPVPTATAAPGSGPTIESELADYAPGGTVTLTGAGWHPGEVVTIVVNDTGGLSWSLNQKVVADENGAITLTFSLPGRYVPDYDVTATGALSGVARATFTDAANLTCTAGTIYGLDDDGRLFRINTSTGVTSAVTSMRAGGELNGLGVTFDGSAAYAVRRSSSPVPIYKYKASSGASSSVGSVPLGGAIAADSIVGAAVSPTNGIYYFGGWTTGGFAIYGWNTNTSSSIGLMGYITVTNFRSPANGDIAFDSVGNLYVVNSLSGTQIMGVVPAASVPTTASTSRVIAAGSRPTGTNAVAFNGVAYDGAGTFFLSTASTLYKADGFTATTTLPYTGGLDAVDLASCSVPGSLTVKKNIAGRFNSTDQFTLTISHGSGASAVTDDSETTTGVATGLQTVMAGPVVGFVGTQYTIAEQAVGAARLTNYVATYSCLLNNGTSFASGTGTSVTLPAFPDSDTGNNIITCTFTNTPRSTLVLQKYVTGRAASGNQFVLTVTDASGATTLATATTTGSATGIQSAVAGPTVAAPGTAYQLSEAGTPSGLTGYTSTYACTRSDTGGTVASGGAAAFTLTAPGNLPVTGASLVCTFTNTPKPVLTLQKTVDNTAGGTAVLGNWTLTAKAGTSAALISEVPTQSPTTSGAQTTGRTKSAAATIGTAYFLSESGTSSGYAASLWSCGGTGTYNFNSTAALVTLYAGADVTCAITNTAQSANLTWKKADGATLLSGSEWTLTGPSYPTGTMVTDCATTCTGLLDTDPVAGQFKVAGLTWGTYRLVERTAPSGYVLDGTTIRTKTVDGSTANLTGDFGTILNTRIAAATVTISKQVQDANGANPTAGQGWAMSASLGSGSTSGVTITPATTQTTGTTGSAAPWSISYPTTSALANVAVSEAQQTGYVFASGTCTVTPRTGTPSTVTLASVGGTVPDVAPGDTVVCLFVNKQSPGTATWKKVGANTALTPLSGSEWTLTGPGVPTSPATVVTDCTSSPCPAGPYKDQDPAAGAFSLTGLVWGGYTLTESKAPVGYRLDTTLRSFTIAAAALTVTVKDSPFRNQQLTVPAIPLTGGSSTDSYLIAGVALLLLAAAVAWRQRGRWIQDPQA